MNESNTPPLYALVPITETEGLEDGKYRVLYSNENKISVNRFNKTFGWRLPGDATHYLRPLPEGTVAVSREELIELLDKVRDMPEQAGSHEINQFIQTKLAQMGE